MNQGPSFSRRACLRSCGAGVLGLGALSNLRALAALAPPGGSGYRALVCIYVYGGNDGFNWIVPASSNTWATYAAARLGLAIPQNQLLLLNPLNPQGETWGMHPSCPELRDSFEAGRLAVIAGVGTLVEPVTKAQYQSGAVQLPPQLFSHNDQTQQWMTADAPTLSPTGWGGRLADNLQSLNALAAISPCISFSGTNVFLAWAQTVPYAMNTDGPVALSGFWGGEGASRRAAFDTILARPRTHVLERAYATAQSRAIASEQLVSNALAQAPAFTTVFPDTWLGQQLQGAARTIAVHAALGIERQVFFVSAGGFDTHGTMLTTHAGLLADLSASLAAFDAALMEIGEDGNVTTFTASEFGRTLSSNGSGTDHGWSSHQIVMGGAVRGRDLYGVMPNLTLDGPDDIGGGRLIPTTSVEQMGATLARWFGVAPAELSALFPNVANFATDDLGFFL